MRRPTGVACSVGLGHNIENTMEETKTELEILEEAKDQAWRDYDKLRAPADAAYKKYQAASKAHKEAVLYEKAKRQVMRDLINAAGKKVA